MRGRKRRLEDQPNHISFELRVSSWVELDSDHGPRGLRMILERRFGVNESRIL